MRKKLIMLKNILWKTKISIEWKLKGKTLNEIKNRWRMYDSF